MQAREDEITQMKQETTRLTKLREAIQRRLQVVEENKAEVEAQKETLRGQISGLERGTYLMRTSFAFIVWSMKLSENVSFFCVLIKIRI